MCRWSCSSASWWLSTSSSWETSRGGERFKYRNRTDHHRDAKDIVCTGWLVLRQWWTDCLHLPPYQQQQQVPQPGHQQQQQQLDYHQQQQKLPNQLQPVRWGLLSRQLPGRCFITPSVKLSQQKVAGLCSCSSVQPAPGQLVVTKAKCCRSGPGDPGEVIVDATTSLGAKSRLVLCPAHLPREYRCYCMLWPTHSETPHLNPDIEAEGLPSLAPPSLSPHAASALDKQVEVNCPLKWF